MAYASWSVVFGEQPTAAKWNILGTNDASFNDGTGIANFSHSITSVSNPYKFLAYLTASVASSAALKIPFDAEAYDSNSNFDSTTASKGRYTAPVNGFYQFSAAWSVVTGGARNQVVKLYKNGSNYLVGPSQASGTGTYGVSVVFPVVQVTAADYFEIYAFNIGGTENFNTGVANTYFGGFLVSNT